MSDSHAKRLEDRFEKMYLSHMRKLCRGQYVGALITCRYSHGALRANWERDECLILNPLMYHPSVKSVKRAFNACLLLEKTAFC